jgi:hypothetical protein
MGQDQSLARRSHRRNVHRRLLHRPWGDRSGGAWQSTVPALVRKARIPLRLTASRRKVVCARDADTAA